MSEERENSTRRHCKLPMTESILSLVVGGTNWLLQTNCINNAGRGGDVQNFHDRIVEAVVGCEEVSVPSEEDQEEELVSAEGDPLGIASDTESEEEHND